MNKCFIVAVTCSCLGLIGASGAAMAETSGRWECSIVGPVSQEPVGDKDGHRIINVEYSCLGVDGVVQGTLYSGFVTSEWDGPQGKYHGGGGTIRGAGGLAVSFLTDGTGFVVMKDGKPIGTQGSGKGAFQFASGTLAALSGKTDTWQSKPAGFGRFTLEFRIDDEPGAVRTSKE